MWPSLTFRVTVCPCAKRPNQPAAVASNFSRDAARDRPPRHHTAVSLFLPVLSPRVSLGRELADQQVRIYP